MRIINNSLVVFAALAILGAAVPAQAQEGPPDHLCILLGMLGAECPSEEDEADSMVPPNTAGAAHVSHSSVISLVGEELQESLSTSTLIRNKSGATATLELAGQRPNSPFTLWWVVFNRPQTCAEAVCTFADEQAEASFFNAGGGRVSDQYGQVRLQASTFADGNLPGLEGEGVGDGLTNPLGAQILLVARSHGDAAVLAEAGELEAALTSLFGSGCPFDVNNPEAEPHDCTEPALAIHFQ